MKESIALTCCNRHLSYLLQVNSKKKYAFDGSKGRLSTEKHY